MKKIFLILIISILITSCAPWVKVGGPYSSKEYTVELPEGWMKSNAGKHLLITRDGIILQNIYIEKSRVDMELSNTKKKLAAGMLPQEAAEVILDNIASNSSILHLNIVENAPVTISGLPGFRLIYDYKSNDGLKRRSMLYGLITGEWYYIISYNAAKRYYYDKDIKTFNRVIESFRLPEA